jgi:hypothetical protein
MAALIKLGGALLCDETEQHVSDSCAAEQGVTLLILLLIEG